MAGILVDVLLKRLATLALDKIEQELKLVVGVKKEIKNLTKKLEAILAVLEDAEQRQVMDGGVKLWLDELNDVSNDMDDVLDEWITRVLKHQMEKQEKQSAKALVTSKKKVCFPFPSSCFRFGQVNQLFLRHEIAAKIEELNERLALIDENKQKFIFQNIITRVPELHEETTSLPNAKTFGREKEKSLIVSKLLSDSSEGNEVPLIIPIVGMGGMGKTSLANLVYNDDKIKSFDKTMWVCVSNPFDEIKIAQAIIEEIDKDNTSKNSNVLQTLTKCIVELIRGKKFLLVLDDVWSPNSHQWEELLKPLRSGAIGSRVLVTTRKNEVATLMKATTQLIPLKELGEEFCLSLFYYSANINESSVSKEFSDIGLEIVKRCNGLPLAAKTLGSLMLNKPNIHEWRDVLNSRTWELERVQENVFRPLLLSYHDLDLAIKRCLLYCVLFPKDYMYNKNTLIELWMSQDYLNAEGSKEMIKIGQNYFDNLVLRSFFQDVENGITCKIHDIVHQDVENGTTCKIHDIVHDFLQYLTNNECLILDFELNASERNEVPNDKIHHLTLIHATEGYLSVINYKKLRTLSVINSSDNSIGIVLESIVHLKCLRTLLLCQDRHGGRPLKIPDMIGELIHLRYLDLSRNAWLEELPSALGSLYNLQTLRLVGCDNLKKVDVGRLINLRQLYVKGSQELQLIEGIEKLTDLHSLDEFRVGAGDEKNKFEHLKDLNQLQGSLWIEIWGNQNMAEKANMMNKAHLLQLGLSFDGVDEREHQEIMNALEPHPGLESLNIYGYKGGAFSHWLSSLHSLRVLTLGVCHKFGFLPPFGKLPSLETLDLRLFRGVSKVGVEFLGIDDGQTSSSSSIFISFPKLKQLAIEYMESWEEWVGVEGWSREEENSENIRIMPCLSQLRIERCKKLKALPDFLWKTPLQKLHIKASPTLENLYRQGIGEEWAKISHIPTIKIEEL